MGEWSASIVKELDTVMFSLGVQEAAVIGLLMASLVSLCVVFVLVRRRLHRATPQPTVSDVGLPETGVRSASDVAAAQAELRELVREFSALAAQVLRTVDRNQMPPRLPEAGGTVLQLLDLGLTPADAARATGMTNGEVALLMNLRKAKVSALHLQAMSSIGAKEPTDEAIGRRSISDSRSVEVNGDGRQMG